jgi:hypothetical protein
MVEFFVPPPDAQCNRSIDATRDTVRQPVTPCGIHCQFRGALENGGNAGKWWKRWEEIGCPFASIAANPVGYFASCEVPEMLAFMITWLILML